MRSWRLALPPGTPIRYLGGLDMLRKVSEIAACEFFAAPAGTAALLPLLADVPGVFYSHPALPLHFKNILQGFPDGVPICTTVAQADPSVPGVMRYDWAGISGESYSIPVAAFLAEALPAARAALSRPAAT